MPTRTAPTPDLTGPDESLARCVGDVEQFFADQFTRRPHRWRGAGFDDLMSLADVDHQLTGAGLRRPAIRVVRDGVPLNPSTYTREARTGTVRIDDLVHPGRLLSLFDGGATIVLQSLQRWWPPITSFCRELETVLGHAVQANAYLTPPGAAGLSPHHDTHDVFVMQVFGQKHWVIREPLVVDPLPRHHSDHQRAQQQPVLSETDLQAGDCLYLPRGFIHSATTQAGASLHLTIGVLATTVHDVLRRLVDRAADEPIFRHALPTAAGTERETLKGIVADLVQWLEALDVDSSSEDTVGALMASRLNRAPRLPGQLLELVKLDAINDSTVVTRRRSGPHPMRTVDDRIEIDLGDRRLELPAVLRPPVDRLLDGQPHGVGELGDLLDGGSRLVLVRRLVREGVLRTGHGS